MSGAAARWDRDGLLRHPAFASLRPVLALCPSGRFPGPDELSELAQALHVASGGGAALRFVPGVDSSAGALERQYEARIYRDGEVPTRPDTYHDLFNALAWLAFPATKARLNQRHYEHLMAHRAGPAQGAGGSGAGSRGTPRDVLTLFDESGVIVACGEPELEALLRGFAWKALFWARRADAQRAMRFFLFGHAVLEKALRPYKGLTAKALVMPVSAGFFDLPLAAQVARADAWAAEHFAQPGALGSTRLLAPVPVLGMPGWEPASACEEYYDDAAVFRPGRPRRLK